MNSNLKKGKLKHYLFGYGSLISKASRAKTGLTGPAWPTRIPYTRRSWNVLVPEMKLAALGASPDHQAAFNGILVEISEAELKNNFDRREKPHGYQRLPLTGNVFDSLPPELSAEDRIWIYVSAGFLGPNSMMPIVQSYVDVILTGCLEFSQEFAVEFIKTTKGWEGDWVNDRRQPRYPRAQTDFDIKIIDDLLKQTIPRFFSKRIDL